jgi:hypothetical protein
MTEYIIDFVIEQDDSCNIELTVTIAHGNASSKKEAVKQAKEKLSEEYQKRILHTYVHEEYFEDE